MDKDQPRNPRTRPAGTEADGLSAYLDTIGEKPLLSPASELRLARRARAGSVRATDELIKRNLRLVIPTAKKFKGQGVPFEDLVQEGNAGLVKAAGRFDPEKGYRFSTYATWWIHQAAQRAVANQARTIRIPAHIGIQRRQLYKARADFEAEHAREPSAEELQEITGLSSEVIEWTGSVPESRASLDAPVRADEPDSSALGAFIADAEQSEELCGEALALLSRVEVERVLGALRPRYRWVLQRSYGLDGEPPASRREIAQQLDVGVGQVGNLVREGHKRLQVSLKAHGIESSTLKDAS